MSCNLIRARERERKRVISSRENLPFPQHDDAGARSSSCYDARDDDTAEKGTILEPS